VVDAPSWPVHRVAEGKQRPERKFAEPAPCPASPPRDSLERPKAPGNHGSITCFMPRVLHATRGNLVQGSLV
jgi:hypothetical protein